MENANNGWAVGDNGLIIKYDGTWSQITSPVSDNLNDLYIVSTDNIWAVGDNGTIIRYNGSVWEEIASPISFNLESVSFVGNEEGWAAGKNGIINFKAGSLVPLSGVLISSAYLMGTSSPVQIIEWNEYFPAICNGCDIKLQVRVAPDNSGMPGTWTDWYGPDGVGTYFTINKGEIAPRDFNWRSWVQYKIEMTSDGLNTPIASEIVINYK